MPEAVTYILSYAASTAGITFGAESSLILTAAGYTITAAAVPAVGPTNRRKAVRRARAVL